jgi:hypothetical protein
LVLPKRQRGPERSYWTHLEQGERVIPYSIAKTTLINEAFQAGKAWEKGVKQGQIGSPLCPLVFA